MARIHGVMLLGFDSRSRPYGVFETDGELMRVELGNPGANYTRDHWYGKEVMPGNKVSAEVVGERHGAVTANDPRVEGCFLHEYVGCDVVATLTNPSGTDARNYMGHPLRGGGIMGGPVPGHVLHIPVYVNRFRGLPGGQYDALVENLRLTGGYSANITVTGGNGVNRSGTEMFLGVLPADGRPSMPGISRFFWGVPAGQGNEYLYFGQGCKLLVRAEGCDEISPRSAPEAVEMYLSRGQQFPDGFRAAFAHPAKMEKLGSALERMAPDMEVEMLSPRRGQRHFSSGTLSEI